MAIGTTSVRLRPSDSGAVSPPPRMVHTVFALAAAAHAISTVFCVHRASQGSLLLVRVERRSAPKTGRTQAAVRHRLKTRLARGVPSAAVASVDSCCWPRQ